MRRAASSENGDVGWVMGIVSLAEVKEAGGHKFTRRRRLGRSVGGLI